MTRNVFLFFLLIAVVSISANDDYFKETARDRAGLMESIKITREDVFANMERRREQLGKMLEKAKEDLADHEAGRSLLSDEEREKNSKESRNSGTKA
mmetsp:Transcript_1278/g.1091  ORF Transcript_1278/g.1091 Transcript_1278/m.1091 type:complete len:97 (-) Transcript_1278:187-477(-)